MKQEHEDKLDDLAEKLADVFLDMANPNNWHGAGTTTFEQTKEIRGNRHWDVKGANQVGLLFARAIELKQRVRYARLAESGGDPPPLPAGGALGAVRDEEDEIQRFEKEAKQLLEMVGARRGGK